LLFRFLTFYAQIPIGAVTYIAWRRGQRKKQQGDGQSLVDFDERTAAVEEAGPLGAAATR
jgi:hypothetical protein